MLDRPVGRVLVIVLGAGLIYGVLQAYPATRPVIQWSIPLTTSIFGLYLLYRRRAGDTLTLIVGCLLVVGGLTRGLFLLVPMTEITGTVANLVPLAGVFTELFARHYRAESQ